MTREQDRDAKPVALSRRTLLAAAIGIACVASSRPTRAGVRSARALYVSHGSPLFLPGNDGRRAELAAWGAQLAKPRGIVVMTPHYAVRGFEVGAHGPGFAMYDLPRWIKRRLPPDLEYATPPSDALAARVRALLAASVRDGDRGGFDHTTWMPLRCLFPAADVPVLEIAFPYLSEAELFALGRKLAPLADDGVLFVASGGMTHNLAAFDAGRPSQAPPAWAAEFDAWASESTSRRNVDALVDWRTKAPAAELAHPDDGGHYRVLLVALGVALGAAHPAERVSFPVAGFEGSMSKRCVELA